MFGKSVLVAGLAALVLSPTAALAHEGRREPARPERREPVVVVVGDRDGRGGRDCDRGPRRDCDRPVIIVREEPRHHGRWDWRHHHRPAYDVVRPGLVIVGRIGF